MNTKTEQISSGLVAPHDHPDFVGGIVWSECELAWINKRISDAEAIIAQKDAEILEQCRINGMGAEREAALLGKVAQQSAALKLAREALLSVCGGYPLHYSTKPGFREANEALAAINEVLKGE